ncbi:hypothetical protein KSS87_021260 [Heliosperma pusillum]|nr:hypothetical protein KSS87_021260 [Heliosperma pusillum]
MSPFPAACKSSFPSGLSKNNDMGRSPHEKQCKSACLSTPFSPFPSARNLEPGIYSSVPNGLLENIELQSNLFSVGSVFQRKCHSDLFLVPQYRCGPDIRKPFLSPVENGFESVASKSGGSGKVTSGNPELTCFTIMEDPESSEEDGNEPKAGLKATDLCTKSSIKEPLCDISVKNTTSLVQNQPVEKQSLESASTEIGISETCDMDSQVNGMSNRRSTRTTRGKENKGFSVGGNSIKNSKAPSSRFRKPKLSGQPSIRTSGKSLPRNNIVSNVKSFIPIVQRNQAAATAPVKRDVNVKALEVAEAAKRLQEKKDNERKQKKEELKRERARLEQKKLREIELAKKLKEEAKKKRDAENAVKKRQRAEEEKMEKERKRQRVEDARCQQKQAQEKLHAWREESRYGTEEERTFEGKELNKKEQKEFDRTIETSTSNPMQELVDAGIVKTKAGDGIPAVDSVVTAESSTPNFYDKPIRRNSEEQSYDISPYQCSDDEEEEDEEIPNKKFIPSWARKSCVSLALSSMQQLDPDTIFPPGSFCSLDEEDYQWIQKSGKRIPYLVYMHPEDLTSIRKKVTVNLAELRKCVFDDNFLSVA